MNKRLFRAIQTHLALCVHEPEDCPLCSKVYFSISQFWDQLFATSVPREDEDKDSDE